MKWNPFLPFCYPRNQDSRYEIIYTWKNYLYKRKPTTSRVCHIIIILNYIDIHTIYTISINGFPLLHYTIIVKKPVIDYLRSFNLYNAHINGLFYLFTNVVCTRNAIHSLVEPRLRTHVICDSVIYIYCNRFSFPW